MRIGEALVRDGVITQAELDDALRVQIQAGGKLGTLLVQLGYLEQKKLYEYLARRFAGAHIFAPGEEPRVAADAVAALPKKIAEHYQIVPMMIDAKTIHVLLLDPTRLPALSAVKSATKRHVVPHVVSEDVLDVLLLKHYGVTPKKKQVVRRGAIELKSTELDDDLPIADAADLLEEIVDEPALDLDVKSAIAPVTADLARAAIQRAMSDEQIATALLGATIGVFHRAALFRLNGAVLTAWDAAGDGVSRRAFEKVQLAVTARSVFGVALSGRTPFLGSVARTEENVTAFATIGWGMPRSAFAMGLWKAGPIALLYADNGPDSQMSVNVNGIIDLAARAAERAR